MKKLSKCFILLLGTVLASISNAKYIQPYSHISIEEHMLKYMPTQLENTIEQNMIEYMMKPDLACSSSMPMKGWDRCYSCDEPLTLVTKDCKLCNNRFIWKQEQYCSLKKCPKNTPLRDEDGNCLPCDMNAPVLLQKSQDCEKLCQNRILWDAKNTFFDNMCILKDCPEDIPLRDIETRCWSCDTNKLLLLHNSEECEKICPNRMLWQENDQDASCVLKECPQGTIRDFFGNCIPCDAHESYTMGIVPFNEQECKKCENLISWKSSALNESPIRCVPKKCPGDLRYDTKGTCKCDNLYNTYVHDPQKCIVCGYKAEEINMHKKLWKCKSLENSKKDTSPFNSLSHEHLMPINTEEK